MLDKSKLHLEPRTDVQGHRIQRWVLNDKDVDQHPENAHGILSVKDLLRHRDVERELADIDKFLATTSDEFMALSVEKSGSPWGSSRRQAVSDKIKAFGEKVEQARARKAEIESKLGRIKPEEKKSESENKDPDEMPMDQVIAGIERKLGGKLKGVSSEQLQYDKATSEAMKYIDSLRAGDKAQYAKEYYLWLRGGEKNIGVSPPKPSTALPKSYASEVRKRLDAIFEPTGKHPGMMEKPEEKQISKKQTLESKISALEAEVEKHRKDHASVPGDLSWEERDKRYKAINEAKSEAQSSLYSAQTELKEHIWSQPEKLAEYIKNKKGEFSGSYSHGSVFDRDGLYSEDIPIAHKDNLGTVGRMYQYLASKRDYDMDILNHDAASRVIADAVKYQKAGSREGAWEEQQKNLEQYMNGRINEEIERVKKSTPSHAAMGALNDLRKKSIGDIAQELRHTPTGEYRTYGPFTVKGLGDTHWVGVHEIGEKSRHDDPWDLAKKIKVSGEPIGEPHEKANQIYEKAKLKHGGDTLEALAETFKAHGYDVTKKDIERVLQRRKGERESPVLSSEHMQLPEIISSVHNEVSGVKPRESYEDEGMYYTNVQGKYGGYGNDWVHDFANVLKNEINTRIGGANSGMEQLKKDRKIKLGGKKYDGMLKETADKVHEHIGKGVDSAIEENKKSEQIHIDALEKLTSATKVLHAAKAMSSIVHVGDVHKAKREHIEYAHEAANGRLDSGIDTVKGKLKKIKEHRETAVKNKGSLVSAALNSVSPESHVGRALKHMGE